MEKSAAKKSDGMQSDRVNRASRRATFDEPVLSVRDLTVEIATPEGAIEPVRSVSFDLKRGEAMALVGESGCGKSLTAMALMRLFSRSPSAIWHPFAVRGSPLSFRSLQRASIPS